MRDRSIAIHCPMLGAGGGLGWQWMRQCWWGEAYRGIPDLLRGADAPRIPISGCLI